MLRESLSERIVFTNPQHARRGMREVVEHLEGFQLRTPGGSFRMNNMIGWGTHALAEWQLVDAKGDAGLSGYDILTFDEQGLILTILALPVLVWVKIHFRSRCETYFRRLWCKFKVRINLA